MKKIRIFLSSSNELAPEREKFELEISLKNKTWIDKGILLHVDRWEDVSAKIANDGSQNEYNKLIELADIFVLLGFTKMGKYSSEEFERAVAGFKNNEKPLIFTYLKNSPGGIEQSLIQFKERLLELKHFYSPFTDYNDLWNQFNKELDKLESANFSGLDIKVFNAFLTKELITAIKPYSELARKFSEKAERIAGWELQAQVSDKAKEIIGNSYVGIIGSQLRKLMAIGKDDFSETKSRTYIGNCVIACKITLQLVCYAMLSEIWNQSLKGAINFLPEQKETVNSFFEGGFEMAIDDYLHLLKALHATFIKNEINFPFSELTGFEVNLQADSPFLSACHTMHGISNKLNNNLYLQRDCFESEKQLTTILSYFNFLAAYKMVSIKNIGYDEIRNTIPKFLHHYSVLGVEDKSKNADFVNYVERSVCSDAVVLYKSNYEQGVNLYPLIIDYNALTFEEKPKICFYSSREFDGSLNYCFLENNVTENLAYKGVLKPATDINEIMKDKEKRKELRLDIVVKQYYEAQNKIVGVLDTDILENILA